MTSSSVDEIWLPSSFLVDVFVDGGVPREKLLVLPIPIDTRFFSPVPFSLRPGTTSALRPLPLPNKGDFNFLSVFKWEQRKGWDILVEAYLLEFTPEVKKNFMKGGLVLMLPSCSLGQYDVVPSDLHTQFGTGSRQRCTGVDNQTACVHVPSKEQQPFASH